MKITIEAATKQEVSRALGILVSEFGEVVLTRTTDGPVIELPDGAIEISVEYPYLAEVVIEDAL